MGGYEFKLGTIFKVEPSYLAKYFEKAPELKYDLNARLTCKEVIWIGASYRNQESMVAMIGLNGDVIRIGYAYDMSKSGIQKYTSGSHELYLTLFIKRRDLKTM